jgi:hypothetical protein
LIFRHFGRQVAHPVCETALALRAREAGLDCLDAAAPAWMARSIGRTRRAAHRSPRGARRAPAPRWAL